MSATPNRLAHETSPYLLQHAHNPVDWYPWGEEAFARARAEDKPIFLSVGYSTCYWCHVMERQSFENDDIAAEMNKRFVNIKVDREERPDVDQLYMTAVQVLTRQGGWPMSVFLTPRLEPFFGGTYFPPTDTYGRPGFFRLLGLIDNAYRNRRDDVKQTTAQLTGILRQLAEPRRPAGTLRVDDAWVEKLIERSVSDFDPVHGGFGSAPKFPRETLLQLLLVRNAQAPSGARKQMLTRTLDALAHGGIRDHLGGGFHRYSTDAKWLVPHFEIMLYDNAMLAWVYVEANRQTGDRRYAAVARDVLDFVLLEMTAPDGSFYTAFDAEVDAQEGLSYLWTREEVVRTLQDAGTSEADAQRFCRSYGLDRGPNFADPHHGTGDPDKNILYLAEPTDGGAPALLDPQLRAMRETLYAARRKRKQPLLDTKVLTSWNALMIRALAHGGRALNEPRYTSAAKKAAQFLLDRHRDADGRLYRTSREGSAAKFAAFLDDYAFLVEALLDLGWKPQAQQLTDIMLREFAASSGGLHFTSASATDLIVRQMIGSDSPLPSGNGVAAKVLLALGRRDEASLVLEAFAQAMEDNGESMGALVEAAALYVRQCGTFTVEASATASTKDRPMSPQELAGRVVKVEGRWVSPTELELKLIVLRGFHLQAHEAGPGLVATSLSVPEGARVEYPSGELRHLEFAEEAVRVYDGTVTLKVTFDQPLTAAIKLGLTYQACDERACLPGVTKAIEVASASASASTT
jgi:uncharacterized protein YyaL (SSP411 family)